MFASTGRILFHEFIDSIHLALYIASISFLASSLYFAVMAVSTSGKFHLRHITCHVGLDVHPAKIIAGIISSRIFFIIWITVIELK